MPLLQTITADLGPTSLIVRHGLLSCFPKGMVRNRWEHGHILPHVGGPHAWPHTAAISVSKSDGKTPRCYKTCCRVSPSSASVGTQNPNPAPPAVTVTAAATLTVTVRDELDKRLLLHPNTHRFSSTAKKRIISPQAIDSVSCCVCTNYCPSLTAALNSQFHARTMKAEVHC